MKTQGELKGKQTLPDIVGKTRSYPSEYVHRLVRDFSATLDQTNVANLSSEIQLRQRIFRMHEHCRKEEERNVRLVSENKQLRKQLEKVQREEDGRINNLISENDKLQKDHKTLEKYLKEANVRQNELEEALDKLRTSPNVNGSVLHALRSTSSSVQSSIQRNRALQQRNERLEKEVQSLKVAYTSLMEIDRKNAMEMNHLRNDYNALQTQNTGLKRELSSLRNEYLKVKREVVPPKSVKETTAPSRPPSYRIHPRGWSELEVANESLESELRDQRTKVSDLQQQVQQLRQEKNDLINRLSQIAGNKLTEGNPAIVDLSDENRPTKLAEAYSELYDNEWTEAFDEQVTLNGLEEQDAVDRLLDILLKAERSCQEFSEMYLSGLVMSAITVPGQNSTYLCKPGRDGDAPDQLRKTLRQVRAMMGPNIRRFIQQEVYASLQQENVSTSERTEIYLNKCLDLCWYMSVIDPPVVLTSLPLAGSEVDKDRYRFYTHSGDVVDFVVWPAMLLQKNGPTLAKGVVQGKHHRLDTT